MVPPKCLGQRWGGAPTGEGSCKVSVSVHPESSSERPASPALWDGSDGWEERTGPLCYRQSGPACSQPWRALLLTPTLSTAATCHFTRSSTRGSEGKGGRKLFLSLLFCSLGVLNIQQAGNRSAGQVSVGRREGAELARLPGRGLG